MCHRIYQSHDFYIILDGEWLVGHRKMKYESQTGKLRGAYTQVEYGCHFMKDDNIVCLLYSQVQLQPVDFFLRTNLGFTHMASTRCAAGCHVSPFIGKEFYVQDAYGCYFYVRASDLLLPVGFRPKDVVFFDGKDVSVRCFGLLSIQALKEVFEHFDAAASQPVENFFHQYEGFLKRLKRKNNEQADPDHLAGEGW